jgi:hypothetical protein
MGRHDVFSDTFLGFEFCISTSVGVHSPGKHFCVARHDIHANADPGADLRVWEISAHVPYMRYTSVVGFSEYIGRLVFFKNDEPKAIIVIDFVPHPPYNCK